MRVSQIAWLAVTTIGAELVNYGANGIIRHFAFHAALMGMIITPAAMRPRAHNLNGHSRDGGCTRPNCLEPGYHSEVHHSPDWAAGGTTDADTLFFACGPDHKQVTDGDQQTIVTDTGRLAWTDGTTPPEINHAHHPEELLRGDTDPPNNQQD